MGGGLCEHTGVGSLSMAAGNHNGITTGARWDHGGNTVGSWLKHNGITKEITGESQWGNHGE